MRETVRRLLDLAPQARGRLVVLVAVLLGARAALLGWRERMAISASGTVKKALACATATVTADEGTAVTAPSTEQIAAWWSADADRYHRWGDLAHGHPAYRRAWVDALTDLVGHPSRDGAPALRVADIGTGTAEIALLLAEMGHDVTGYDIAPGMLQKAKVKSNAAGIAVRFTRGDAYDLPSPTAAWTWSSTGWCSGRCTTHRGRCGSGGGCSPRAGGSS